MFCSSQFLRYGRQSVKNFEQYFELPRKRGRPKKKKRRSNQKNQQPKKKKAQQQCTIDLTGSAAAQMCVQSIVGNQKSTRRNWDKSPWKEHRERCVKSWQTKSDLFREGEALSRFCERNAIPRQVFYRRINRDDGVEKKSRGRSSLLSKSVQLHLCEGM